MKALDSYIDALDLWFSDKKGTITAFSGGVDSTLVLFLSKLFLGKQAIGCISISPSLKRKDYAFAIDFCRDNDIELEVVETAELVDENYYLNPDNRCYFCKSHLYKTLEIVSQRYPGYVLLNGTNLDDLGDYRPGLEAARENDILSPLLDCKIDKKGVRDLAKYYELANSEKPASPCLSSRVPYNHIITTEKLSQIEKAESLLNEMGFPDVRVRHYGDTASLEVPHNQVNELKGLMQKISPDILSLGFKYCQVDEEGFVSGKLNRVIQSS